MEMNITYDTPLVAALEEVTPHDHLSLVYETSEDHYSVAIPFIRIGLERGEKCFYIADAGTEGAVREAMHAQNIDVDHATAAGQLVVVPMEKAFLHLGRFDAEWMPTLWKDKTAEALQEGFSALRATGETEWVLCGAPGLERWMEYESRLTQVLGGLNCFALCQYDRLRLPPELIVDVISTHPTVIYRGVVCRNMYYVPPDEYLGGGKAALEAERLLNTLRERAEIEFTLRQQRDDLRRSFDQLRALSGRLQLVREEERTRVAREIHDELGQALTAIKIDLSSLVHELPSDKKLPSESVLKRVDQTIQSVRRIATELRPGVLDDMGLLAAVEWAAEEFQSRTGTRCDMNLPDAKIVIDPESATALFRIFQETLTNVARHANATEVDVRLAREDGSLILEVHDNGKGVSSEQVSAGKSLGILGMRERALLLGGELVISGAPGKGTTVRVRVPDGRHKKPE